MLHGFENAYEVYSIMLRGLVFALLGLSLFAGPAAARGDGPAAGGRRAEARAAVVSMGAKTDRAFLLRRAVAVRPAAPSSACARRGPAAARCGGGAAVQPLSWRGWAQGLPPALGVQAQGCPAGTMATLAEGHDDIVRCIPI